MSVLYRLFGIKPKQPERPLREVAIEAVRTARPANLFTHTTPDAPGDGALSEDGYRHVVANPLEYFLCSHCEDGPWHRSWTGTHHRNRALGPCCTGAG